MKSPLNNVFKGIAIGGEGYIEKIKQKISLTGRNREISETKFAGTLTAEEIIGNISDVFRIERKKIFNRSRNNIYSEDGYIFIKGKNYAYIKRNR